MGPATLSPREVAARRQPSWGRLLACTHGVLLHLEHCVYTSVAPLAAYRSSHCPSLASLERPPACIARVESFHVARGQNQHATLCPTCADPRSKMFPGHFYRDLISEVINVADWFSIVWLALVDKRLRSRCSVCVHEASVITLGFYILRQMWMR